MEGTSMVMSSTGSPVTSGSMPSSTATMDMGDMSMGPGACKINMLWNWYTIDACFLSTSWHVRSGGAFAASCLGVIGLVLVLEFLRRLGKEYDRFLVRTAARRRQEELLIANAAVAAPPPDYGSGPSTHNGAPHVDMKVDTKVPDADDKGGIAAATVPLPVPEPQVRERRIIHFASGGDRFRPSIAQQALRALLHMLQFAVAYFIMLLAMYYNGYIIICIFIGAFLGFFVFGWESVTLDGPKEETTVCCG